MKVKIIVFSQTGNTRKVAKAMADAIRGLGHDVRCIPLKKAARDDFRRADLVGVGAPCFESQAPTPMRQFLASLPALVYTRAFVFATSGGAPGRVLRDLALPLKKKGAIVLGGFLCRGTCYHPVPCLEGRFPDRPNAGDLEKARRFARSVAALAAAGEVTSLPDENRAGQLSVVQPLLWGRFCLWPGVLLGVSGPEIEPQHRKKWALSVKPGYFS